MKNIHGETDNNRMTRLTETFSLTLKREPKERQNKSQQKIFDCSECGKLFNVNEELKIHNSEHHTSKLPSQSEVETKEGEDNLDMYSDDESEEYDDLAFYDMEYTPKTPSGEEISGISFKGDSEEFQLAHKAIESIMTKPRNTYNFEGIQVFVKSVPKANCITLEITTTNGENDCVGLKFYKPKKKAMLRSELPNKEGRNLNL